MVLKLTDLKKTDLMMRKITPDVNIMFVRNYVIKLKVENKCLSNGNFFNFSCI